MASWQQGLDSELMKTGLRCHPRGLSRADGLVPLFKMQSGSAECVSQQMKM
jgi:hypothetical protein